MIIAGHGRVTAALKLGLDEVPVIYADNLSEQQIKEYRILDNKLNESEWIDSELKIELPELDFTEFDIDFGEEIPFDEDLLDELFTDAPEKEKEPKRIQCPHCGEWFEI